jgi:hypothetical protein
MFLPELKSMRLRASSGRYSGWSMKPRYMSAR